MFEHAFSWRALVRIGLPWLLLCGLVIPAVAQDTDRGSEVLEELSEQYRVLRSAEGYVLVPETPGQGPKLIEIEDGLVMADGLVVDDDQLRDLVGEEATLILELARLEEPDLEDIPDPFAVPEPPDFEPPDFEPPDFEAPEPPERPRRQRGVIRTDTRVSFGSGLTVESNEQTRDVVVFGAELEILGEVRGDAVAIGGPISIEGEVHGDVVALGGSVFLGPTAVVNGDVNSIGGDVIQDPASHVRGNVAELSGGPTFDFDDLDLSSEWLDWMWPGNWFGFGWNDGFDLIGNAIVLSIVILGLLLLTGRLVPRIADRVVAEPWKAALVGLLVQVLFLPVVGLLCIILLVSVVGIPLAILAFPLSLVLMVILFFFGYAAVALVAGRWIDRRFDRKITNLYVLTLLGILLIQGWSILGELLSFLSGPIKFTAVLLVIGGFLVKYTAWTVGLGAMVLHVFGPKQVIPPSPAWAEPDDEDLATADGYQTHGFEEPAPPAEDDWSAENDWPAEDHVTGEYPVAEIGKGDSAHEDEESDPDTDPDTDPDMDPDMDPDQELKKS